MERPGLGPCPFRYAVTKSIPQEAVDLVPRRLPAQAQLRDDALGRRFRRQPAMPQGEQDGIQPELAVDGGVW
jgi:hypothetical protein